MRNEPFKAIVLEYLSALSGKVKTPDLIDKFVSDHPLKEHILAFEAGFPRYKMVPEELIAEGNKVAARLILKARHEDTFNGIPATGKKVNLPFLIIYEIENGKIAHHWMGFDRMAFMEQLGVMQPA